MYEDEKGRRLWEYRWGNAGVKMGFRLKGVRDRIGKFARRGLYSEKYVVECHVLCGQVVFCLFNV